MDPPYDMSCLSIPVNSQCSIHVLNEFSPNSNVILEPQVDSGSDSLSASPSSDYGSERTGSPATFIPTHHFNMANSADQHVVHLLVESSETLSIKLGDNYQLIPGPAKVKMVSETGPPGPLPLQVPPGHVVQQIVDESGILTHVILGSQSTVMQQQQSTPPPPPVMTGYYPAPIYDPNTGYSEYHLYGEATPVPVETHDNGWTTYNIKSTPTSYRMTSDKVEVVSRNQSVSSTASSSSTRSKSKKKRDLQASLSVLELPRVDKIESRCASVLITPPHLEAMGDHCHLIYEILLSDHGKEGKYRQVYIGDAFEITLKDLKPATEYFIKIQCKCGSVVGKLTESVDFKTKSAIPDRPIPPKLANRSKTTVALKWGAATDNGSKITSYTLQCGQSGQNDDFSEVFSGLQRQYRVTKLQASTSYWFRLSASNALGMSEFSELVSFSTCGTVPSAPSPPIMDDAAPNCLLLAWKKRPMDDSFTLQMEQKSSGHGFLTIYNGANTTFRASQLTGDTSYDFRLNAINDEGSSGWSDTVAFETLPDIPERVGKPSVKGKVSATSFRVCWNPVDLAKEYTAEIRVTGHEFTEAYLGKDTQFFLNNLQHSTAHDTRVAARNGSGQSGWSEVLTVKTMDTCPGLCGHIATVNKAASWLHLKWSPPADDGGSPITKYELMRLADTDFIIQTETNSYIVNELQPVTTYQFKIRAVNKIGTGPWSEGFNLCTDPDIPGDVELSAHAKSPYQIQLQWTQASDNGAEITAYRLESWDDKKKRFVVIYNGDGQLSFDVKSLQPASFHSFRVQAINKVGVGPFSPVTDCSTLPASPAQVSSLSYTSAAQSITLKWTAPDNHGSPITQYNLDTGEKAPIVIPAPSTEYLLSGLQTETSYRFRLQAVNDVGVGSFSPILKAVTGCLPPAAPKLECSARASNSLKLRWGEHKKAIRSTLEMKKPKSDQFEVLYTGFNQTFKVNKLLEKTTYIFRIFASNEAGDGEPSGLYHFTTTIRAPAPMKPPMVSNLKSDGCAVLWTPNKNTDFHYRLQMSAARQDFKEMYNGQDDSFELTGLSPNSDFTIRVCAIRFDEDGSPLYGGFSEAISFSTPPVKGQKEAAREHQSKRRDSVQKEKPKHLTDTQWALVILLMFGLFSIVVALGVQNVIIAYFSDN